jgi:hypothetical protein
VVFLLRRYYGLKQDGWRLIRIKSIKDYLPFDSVILQWRETAKGFFNKGHSWVEIDIDKKILRTKGYMKIIDCGELRSTYKLKKILKSKVVA